MGLTIHSIGELPTEAQRGYYLYLLDYGWEEPLGDAIKANFDKMADLASRHNAVVMQGVAGSHFADEVLSWHHINGQDAEDLLPAILITTRHPSHFREGLFSETTKNINTAPMILVPIKHQCKTVTDVIDLIHGIFNDIRAGRELQDFRIADEMRAGKNGAIADALVLQPNISGVGIDLKRLFEFLRGKNNASKGEKSV